MHVRLFSDQRMTISGRDRLQLSGERAHEQIIYAKKHLATLSHRIIFLGDALVHEDMLNHL